jgi:nitroreductase
MPTLALSPDELLTTTRCVRKRLDLTRPVSLDLVRECLEVALQAPSASNRQAWQWVVINDESIRQVIGDYYRRAAAASLFLDDPERSAVQHRVGESVAYLGEHMGEVPVLVIACISAPSLRAGSQAGLWGSLLPAAWSYMLAARARGLGTAWTTLHMRYEKEISELLGIPADIRQGVLIPTAYYTGDAFRPAVRQPLDDVLHINSW